MMASRWTDALLLALLAVASCARGVDILPLYSSDRGPASATPGPGDLPLHSWERQSWAARPALSSRQAAALLEEELLQRESQDAEDTVTSPTELASTTALPRKKIRVKKVRRAKHMSVPIASPTTVLADDDLVPQPHMLDGATRVRRQHYPESEPDRDQALEESRVKRGGHHSVGPVHTFVKTDKHGNYKWGVRHHVHR